MEYKNKILIHKYLKIYFLGLVLCIGNSCKKQIELEKGYVKTKDVTAKEMLGNPNYQAICYGAYRKKTRDIEPSIQQIKDDLKILQALDFKMIRTYNVHYKETKNLLKAISDLKKEDPNFEMYVMLGAWIDCKNAWTEQLVNHNEESNRNATEIATAVQLANKYSDIIKIISVGNEAMVKWATSYYVEPHIILKWVKYLQHLKNSNKLSKDIWITCSDDYASWGGGDTVYHTKELEEIIKTVDFVSMHIYPFHNTHYNPQFWKTPPDEVQLTKLQNNQNAMQRAHDFAVQQYNEVKKYVHSISPNKPIHIGETGWASSSDGYYGPKGSKAADEYKQALYYKSIREWSDANNISCFFFEAFDEPWKDKDNKFGSENHFGLFTVDGKAKYALWDAFDKGIFTNLNRDANKMVKTNAGQKSLVLKNSLVPNSI